MKTNFAPVASADSSCSSRVSFSGVLRNTLILLTLLVCFKVNAQNGPACSISGPLKANVNDGSIAITSEILSEGESPVITYSLVNNTSGASIVSKGSFNYESFTGVGKQTIMINAGSLKGSFNVLVTATTPNGSCKSSKSVTVRGKSSHQAEDHVGHGHN